MDVIRLHEAPKVLGVSISTVRRLVDKGKLKAIQLSPRCRGFSRSEIDRFLNQQA